MSKNTQISELINYLSVDGSGNIVITGSLIGPAGSTYATQTYVATAISNLVNAAPTALDTLAELSAALNNDASFATTVTNSLAGKLALTGGTLSGALNGTSASFSGAISGTSGSFNGNVRAVNLYNLYKSDNTTLGGQFAYDSSLNQLYIWNNVSTGYFSIYTNGTERFTVLSNGNIGMGTNSPTAKLHIYSSDQNMASSGATSYTYAKLRIEPFNTSSVGVSFGLISPNVNYIQTGYSDGSSSPLVLNPYGGNVGIGTSIADNTYQGLTIYGTNPSLRLKASASGSWTWTEYVNSSGVNTFSMGVSHSTPVFVIRAGAGLDNPHFALSTAGNVGIGTVAPVSKLDINGGNIRLGEYLNSASSLIGKQRAGTGVFYSSVEFYSTTSEDVIIFNTHLSGSSAGERARITGGGSMGLGTTSPVRKMDIVAPGDQLRLAYNSSGTVYTDFRNDSAGGLLINTSGDYIIQYLNGSEKIRLNTTGLGVGTSDPAVKFDVNGAMGLRGSNYFYFGHNSGSIGGWTTRMYANGAEHRFNANGFAFTNEGYGSSVWLQILSNGYVGLGTTSPGALLDLGATGGRKLLVYNGGTGNQSGFGVDLDGVSYGAGAFFAYGGSDIGRYVIGSYDGTTFRGKLTVHGSGAVAIAAGVPTYPKLNVGGSLQTKRTIHSWYEATPPDGTSYWHIKTNMWGGGSPYGNVDYTMSLFKGYFYTYSAMVREGMVGFHNWSGSIYNTASNGNLFANVYVSSDGYVVLVVNCGGGSYNSLTIDWYQAYEYPFRDKTVTAATNSASTSGVY